MGPGAYNTIEQLGGKKKGLQWVKGTTQNKKKAEGAPPGVAPGPGHYNSHKTDIFPIYKYKQSSVFMSKVERQTGQKPPKPKGKPPAKAPAQIMEEDDYYDEDDDENPIVPGPGHYYNPKLSTTFKQQNVPKSMQFFGSSVERFTDNPVKETHQTLGPGSYSVQI